MPVVLGVALVSAALVMISAAYWSVLPIPVLDYARAVALLLAILGSVLLGSSLVLTDQRNAAPRPRPWLPLLAAALIIVASITLWAALRQQIAESRYALGRSYLSSIEDSLDATLQIRTEALRRLSERLAITASSASATQLLAQLKSESTIYLRDFPSLRGITWTAADFGGRIAISRPGDLPSGEDPDFAKRWSELLRAARETKSQQASEAVRLGDGAAGRLLALPAIHEGQVRGYLLAEIEFAPLFSKTLESVAASVSLRILDNGTPIYARGDVDSVPILSAVLPPRLGAMRIELRQPDTTTQRLLPEALLFSGVVMGALFAMALHFAAVSRARAHQACVMREDALQQMAGREHVQDILLEIAEELRAVFDSMSDAVYLLDNDWCFAYLNAQARLLLRHPDGELIGKNIWIEYPELVGTALEQHYREAMSAQRTMDFSIYFEPLSAWFSLRVYPHPRGLAVYFLDITERREAEHAIRVSESRFRNVARATADAIWDWDLYSNAVWWSDGLQRLFGHPPESVQSDLSSWTERIHPDDQPSVVAGIRAVIDSGAEIWSDEYRFIRLDGSYAYVMDRGFVIRNDAGQAVRMVGGMTDVTERRINVERLRDSEEYLRAILDTALEGILTIDESGIVVSANFASEQIFGCKVADLIDRSVGMVMPKDSRQWHDAFLAKHGITSVVRLLGSNREVTGMRRNGKTFPMDLSVTEVHRAGRRLFTAFIRDITPRREAELALRKSLVDLGNRNRELQNFAFVASHDLQEPLRKIRVFSDRLLLEYAPRLDERANEYLKRNVQAAIRMQSLIDELLTYSRVAARGEIFEAVDLNRLLATVVDDLDARIESSGGKIEWEALPTITGDATQLRQLFQNLIANALKFRHPERTPRVHVSAEALDSGNAASGWLIRIEDNGIGFDNQHAERIFAPFHRLHGRSEYEGTGIGLAIVQRIVENHGGSVAASAKPGLGATFSIVLPRRTEPSPSPAGTSRQ